MSPAGKGLGLLARLADGVRALLEEVRALLEEALQQSAKARVRLEPVRSARFLLTTAVRLLPRSERARYLEEFRAELLDVPRNTQLRHALSVLRGVFVLRLRRGLRNKAADATARKAKEE